MTVEGEVETQDTDGVVRGTVERFPPSLYLRETALTRIDPAIADFAARRAQDAGGDALADAARPGRHGCTRDMAFDTNPTGTTTTAAEAFALKRGVCQDLTHIFIAAARSLGIPARYIGGHFHRSDGVTEQEAGHAWAEALRARSRLGRVRSDQRHQRDRRACPRRGRARLSRRGAGARHAGRAAAPRRWRSR